MYIWIRLYMDIYGYIRISDTSYPVGRVGAEMQAASLELTTPAAWRQRGAPPRPRGGGVEPVGGLRAVDPRAWQRQVLALLAQDQTCRSVACCLGFTVRAN